MRPISVQEWPSQPNSFRTQRERLDHIRARSYAAINHDVALVEDFGRIPPEFGQNIDGRRGVVGAPSAMVGDNHAGHRWVLGRLDDVGDGLEALHNNGQICVFLPSALVLRLSYQKGWVEGTLETLTRMKSISSQTKCVS